MRKCYIIAKNMEEGDEFGQNVVEIRWEYNILYNR